MPVEIECVICGKKRKVSPSEVAKIKTCSKECMRINRTGNNNPRASKKNWLNVKCKCCGKMFHQKPTSVRLGKARAYCSDGCRESSIGLVEQNCEYCGKSYQVYPCNKDRLKCCSKKCSGLLKTKNGTRLTDCLNCGVEFSIKNSDFNRTDIKGAGSFCGIDCKALYMSKSGTTTSGENRNTKSGGIRSDLKIYLRSRWEANYARLLNVMVSEGIVHKWLFEPETFSWIVSGKTIRYTPDFKVFYSDGTFEFHEVKGYLTENGRSKIEAFLSFEKATSLIVVDRRKYFFYAKSYAHEIPMWETDNRGGL